MVIVAWTDARLISAAIGPLMTWPMASTWLDMESTVARASESKRWLTQALYKGPITLRRMLTAVTARMLIARAGENAKVKIAAESRTVIQSMARAMEGVWLASRRFHLPRRQDGQQHTACPQQAKKGNLVHPKNAG